MKLLERARRALGIGTSQKASAAAPAIAGFNVGQARWTDRRYDKMTDEAYRRNAVAFACVKRIATGCASVPLKLKRKKRVVEEHEALSLLKRPSPRISGRKLFEAMYAYYLLSGNMYLEKVIPPRRGALPRELWTLRPDRMKVVPGKHALPKGFEYTAGGQTISWQADELTGEGDILHNKDFNPLDDWYGMSRIEAAAYGVDRHNAASAHNAALLQNGARPSGALIFKPVVVNGEAQSAPSEVIDKARSEVDRRHAGPENAGRSMVFGGDVDWKSFGMTPRDMDFALGKDDAGWDVCIALGFPPILLIKGQATYNNIAEAKLELWEETNIPLMEDMVGELNHWLMPHYGDGFYLEPDLDAISALEPRRQSKRKSTLELVDAGVIEADEAREDLQYPERPANAVRKVEASVVTALTNAVPDTGYEPLVRYLSSVGLYDRNQPIEDLIRIVMDLTGVEIAPEEDELEEEDSPDAD